ncbi:MAG: hypothetical protein U9N87_15355, partial [Planctomycetota bacterium]|nr:hypothetical protein [Planctomycetota bacterium]
MKFLDRFKKLAKRRAVRPPQSTACRRAAFENLEGRNLLSAAGVLSQCMGIFNGPSDTDQLDVYIDPGSINSMSGKAMLGLHLKSRGTGDVDPDAVAVRAADAVWSLHYQADDVGGTSDSILLSTFAEGEYSLELRGHSNGFRQYELDTFLVGDVDGDMQVELADLNLIGCNLCEAANTGGFRDRFI